MSAVTVTVHGRTIDPAEWTLATTLFDAMMTANALDGRHAWQSQYWGQQGTYGAISEALIMCLSVILNDREAAEDLYWQSIECGEPVWAGR